MKWKTSTRGGPEEPFYSPSLPTSPQQSRITILLGLGSVFSQTSVTHGMKRAENTQVSPAGDPLNTVTSLALGRVRPAIGHGERTP